MERDRKRKQAMEVDQSAMANLPTHILIEIISRLPIKAVMTVRCVSKSLLKLVSEPYFKELYSGRAPTELLLRNWEHEDLSLPTTLYLAEPKFLDESSIVVDMKFSAMFDLQRFSVRPKNTLNVRATRTELFLVNSCHGLVCYCGTYNRFAVICNPITGEFVTIPAPLIKGWDAYYGLGFSPKDNRYKLLRLITQVNVETYIKVWEIYTFGGSGSWKSLANCPAVDLPFSPTFYAGVLHWRTYEAGDIVTFDFDTELFGKLVTTPHVGDMVRSSRICSLRMGVLGGCLYIGGSVGDCVEVWVMKEYGVPSSWIKVFSIQNDTGHSWQSYKPIKYLQNREILMFRSYLDIVCYSPDTTSAKSIGRFSSGYEEVFIRPSLVSLKIMLGGDVKVHHFKSWNAHKSRTEVATIPRWWTSSCNWPPREQAKEQSSSQAVPSEEEIVRLKDDIKQMKAVMDFLKSRYPDFPAAACL